MEFRKKNYEIQIDSISEDELSILKNEIYKKNYYNAMCNDYKFKLYVWMWR